MHNVRIAKLELLEDIFGTCYEYRLDEISFACPRSDCDSARKGKKKLSVNIEKDNFHCWVCAYSGKITRLLYDYGTSSHRAQYNKLVGIVDLNDFEKLLRDAAKAAEHVTVELPYSYKPLTVRPNARALEYLAQRGVTTPQILQRRIGYCNLGPSRGAIVFPSYNSKGRLNFFIMKSMLTGRYTLAETEKYGIVFNEGGIDWGADNITFVEGIFDALMIGGNVVPLFGSTFRKTYSHMNTRAYTALYRKLKTSSIKNVRLALDNDAATKELRIADMLIRDGFTVSRAHIPKSVNDLGEMTKEQISDLNFTVHDEWSSMKEMMLTL